MTMGSTGGGTGREVWRAARGDGSRAGRGGKAVAAGVSRGGRPPKFDEPSMPVTVTLPLSTLAQLASLGKDRAKAIVKAVRSIVVGPKPESAGAAVVPVGEGSGLVVVRPSRYLRGIDGLRLVEILPGRSILTVRSGMSSDSIEVALTDVLDTVPDSETVERSLLVQLLAILRAARKTRRMTKEEILLVGTD